MKQIECLLGGKRVQYLWIDAQEDSELLLVVVRIIFFLFVLFASFLLGISSTFSLASRLALPGSESVFGLSQGPPVCHVQL